MFLGRFLRAGAVAAGVLLGVQLEASADPVTYDGTLTSGVTATGALPLDSTVSDATKADYWKFWATAGDVVTVITRRIDGGLDPSQWVYAGLFADTTDTGLTNGTNSLGNGAFIDFGDDELSPAVSGPFGDPQSIFTATITGWYTVAVTNFLGSGFGGDDQDYDYDITARGNTGTPGGPVPEPTLLALLACGSFGVALSRRRKTA